jgi:hypothetical protein
MLNFHGHRLFDHRRFFRRKGAKGPFTWKIGIVTGEPYGFVNGTTSKPLTVPATLAKRGLAAVAHPALSPWYPGSTALFVVGRSLDLAAAEKLGLTACASTQEELLPLGLASF